MSAHALRSALVLIFLILRSGARGRALMHENCAVSQPADFNVIEIGPDRCSRLQLIIVRKNNALNVDNGASAAAAA